MSVVLAQERVPDKSSEPKVIDALLKDIDVSGAIISADALFANVLTLQKFLNHGADDLIGLKGNQGNFHPEVQNFFSQAREAEYEEVEVEKYLASPEKGHGTIEERSVWPELKSMIEVVWKGP